MADVATISPDVATTSPDKAYAALYALYRDYGTHDYICENVSQLEHALQAGQVARQHTDNPELIAAALLHDVGHLLGCRDKLPDMPGRCGKVDHDRVGADFLRQLGCSELVCAVVGEHVNAKRYLAARQAGYVQQLSRGSQLSLQAQGGPMTAEQACTFETHPHFATILAFRRWEDQAKNVALARGTMETFATFQADIMRAVAPQAQHNSR